VGVSAQREIDAAARERGEAARPVAEAETEGLAGCGLERSIDGALVEVGAASARWVVDACDEQLRAAHVEQLAAIVEQLDAALRVDEPRLARAAVVLVVAHHRVAAERRVEALHGGERGREPGHVVDDVAGEHDEIGPVLARAFDDLSHAFGSR
jgi:hypothetical protein